MIRPLLLGLIERRGGRSDETGVTTPDPIILPAKPASGRLGENPRAHHPEGFAVSPPLLGNARTAHQRERRNSSERS